MGRPWSAELEHRNGLSANRRQGGSPAADSQTNDLGYPANVSTEHLTQVDCGDSNLCLQDIFIFNDGTRKSVEDR